MSSSDETTELTRGEPAQFRAYQRGEIRDDPVVPRWVGKVAREDEDLILALDEAYRQAGDSFEATDLYDRLVRPSSTRNASRAIREGDPWTLQNIVGETSDRRDLSGVQTIRNIREKLSRPAYVAYLHGVMGDGKTDLALLLSEIWRDEMEANGYRTEIGSNVKSWERATSITEWDEFDAWLDDADETERRLFVFDEASKHASGYAADAQEARELLGKTINLIRKSFASIIVIGHTGKDVHADIRRKATHLIRKESTKEATFRERVDTGSGEGDIRDDLRVSGIPPTSETYDTYESSTWSWGDEDDEADRLSDQLRDEVEDHRRTRDEAIACLSFWGATSSQIAALDWVDVSPRRVQQIARETDVPIPEEIREDVGETNETAASS
jgi:hypothetical protein